MTTPSKQLRTHPSTLGSQKLLTASVIRSPDPKDRVVKIRLPLKHILNAQTSSEDNELTKISEMIAERLSEMAKKRHRASSRRRRVKLRFRRERPRVMPSRMMTTR